MLDKWYDKVCNGSFGSGFFFPDPAKHMDPDPKKRPKAEVKVENNC